MPTFQYKKLVRNNIPGWHEERGYETNKRQLTGEDLKAALVAKLHEEADEVPVRLVVDDEIIEEIGDVQQVLDNLKTVYGITDKQVRTVMDKKRNRSGDFLDGHYIESTYMPDENDEWVAYCRERPEKYPEVKASGHVDPDLPKLERGVYRHTKSGKLYEVTDVTFHTETNQPLVLYRPLYKSKYEIFARPYDVFIEQVEINGASTPRFKKVA